MLGLGGWRQQERRSRARDRAVWLIRDHGDEAEAVVSADLARADLSGAERERLRRVRSELRKERAHQAAHGNETWKPALFSIAGIAAVLGIGLGRRRRSSRRRR